LVSLAVHRSTPKRLVHLAGRAERDVPLQSKAAFRRKRRAFPPCLNWHGWRRALAPLRLVACASLVASRPVPALGSLKRSKGAELITAPFSSARRRYTTTAAASARSQWENFACLVGTCVIASLHSSCGSGCWTPRAVRAVLAAGFSRGPTRMHLAAPATAIDARSQSLQHSQYLLSLEQKL
jgi:hypothetical protein